MPQKLSGASCKYKLFLSFIHFLNDTPMADTDSPETSCFFYNWWCASLLPKPDWLCWWQHFPRLAGYRGATLLHPIHLVPSRRSLGFLHFSFMHQCIYHSIKLKVSLSILLSLKKFIFSLWKINNGAFVSYRCNLHRWWYVIFYLLEKDNTKSMTLHPSLIRFTGILP